MKLLELVGVKKFADSDLEAVLKSMGTHTEIGRGSFAVALKNTSKPEVVKFWISDSSYDEFINYVAKHPYKHFPKLYSKPKKMTTFFLHNKDFPDNVQYVKMELLNKIHTDDDRWRIVRDIFSELRDCRNKKDVDDFVKFYLRHPNDTYTKEYLDMLHKMVDNVPEFCHKMYEMLREVMKFKNVTDIHDENVMLRDNGELVITDPIYNENDSHNAKKIKNALYHLKKDDEDAIKGKTPKKKTGESK
jgi:hypothetical protein